VASESSSAGFGRRIELIAALTAVALLVVGCVVVLRPFFSALLWAIILTYSTWPAYARLERRLRRPPWLAALIMTVALALAFILPLLLVATALTDVATGFADWLRHLLDQGPPPPPAWIARLPLVGPDLLDQWRELASNTAEFAEFAKPHLVHARAWALATGVAIGGAALELSLSVVAAFFLYRDGIYVVDRIRAIGQRIAGDRVHHLLLVTASTIRGVVYGTVGGALVQGILASLGFWLAGVPAALFLGSLTFLFGLVPGGPPLIWISVAVWLVSEGRIGWALFVALWGFVLISGLENVIKPYLISRESRLPFLVGFLGVLGGALAFGFIGVFLGPTLLGVAYALLLDWASTPAAVPLQRPERPQV
jgi:predicted PurR-regulated permease PerM